jgi:hypothetical protein
MAIMVAITANAVRRDGLTRVILSPNLSKLIFHRQNMPDQN